MKTYDYYKGNPTQQVYYNIYWFNENGEAGYECTSYDKPFAIEKGVWSIVESCGATTYIPEGAANFDENADKIVWGRFVKGDDTKAGETFEEYIETVDDLDAEFC